jgi:hypothetical protein
MRRRLIQGGAAALALLLTSAVPAPEAVRYVIGRGGDGNAMTVTRDGDRFVVDYQSLENGRGPKYHETIALDDKGLPVAWTVAGSSLFGTPFEEKFARTGDRAVWTSQAEAGDEAAGGKLYIVNDGSPFALGIYARALLKAPNRTLSALPYGQLTLVKIAEGTPEIAGAKVYLTRYRIDGIDVAPSYVVLDDAGGLIAAASATREGYADAVKALPRQSDTDEARDTAGKIAHRLDMPVEIRNVRIFDAAAGKLTGPSTVTSFRGRITGVIPYVADTPLVQGNRVIDGAGGTLVPGLHDMHAHLTPRGALFYLAAGVTSVRDQGNNGERMMAMMRDIESGAMAGPRVVPNIFLEGVSPYSSHAGWLPKTLDEAKADIRWGADRGYFQIKLYNSMNPAWVKPLADEAHRLGLGVTGHVPAFMNADDVIRAGYNDIAHINQLMLGWVLKPGEDTRTPLRLTALARLKDLDLGSAPVRATLALMKQHKVALDPTLVILERLMLSRARTVQAGDVDYLDHMPVAYQRYRRRTFAPIDATSTDAVWRASFDKVMATIRLLHANGVQLLPGTDDATGFTVHREIELYTLAGIPNAEALRLDTLDADRYMRRDGDYGTITRGKVSDFFLIPATRSRTSGRSSRSRW